MKKEFLLCLLALSCLFLAQASSATQLLIYKVILNKATPLNFQFFLQKNNQLYISDKTIKALKIILPATIKPIQEKGMDYYSLKQFDMLSYTISDDTGVIHLNAKPAAFSKK